eukprot:gene48674-23936_t
MAAAPASGDTARVLCYGDSLTAGYHSMGFSYAPWAPGLASGLRALGVAAAEADAVPPSPGLTAAQLADGMAKGCEWRAQWE